MEQFTTLCVGLDVHKDSISVAHATENHADPPHFVGPIGTRPCDITRWCGGFAARHRTWCSLTKPARAAMCSIAT